MATIYTRAAKGSALTWTEGDANITNLNNAKIENVVEDTTPQLGGNLDVNGNSIVSASNGDIAITPNGTGAVIIDGNEFPQTQGAAGEVLTADGSGLVEWKLNQTLSTQVYNADSVTINKGEPVYVFGSSGTNISVKRALNTGDATSAQTLGLANENISAGATGVVICQGLIKNVDTSTYSAGDALYLGATAGSKTTTKPSEPNHLVYLGFVETVNASSGRIYVRVQNGYELAEIHDVNINNATALANNHLLRYNSASTRWENAALDIVTDTTPQLGGNLDVNGNSIVSTSNGNITLAPNGTGKVIINGTLQVDGTTTTVNSTVVTVDDPVFTLGGDTAPTVDDNKDRGIEFRWHNGTTAKLGFFGFDDSTGYLTFIPDATNTSEVFSGTLGDIQAANFRGALIGNADTASNSSAVTLTADNTTNATRYPLFSDSATGNVSPRTDTGFTYNPSTNTLTAGTFSGSLAVGNITGLGTGVSTFLATPSSANLISAVSDETGSGSLVFANTPTLVSPILGTPTSGNLSNCTADGTNSVGFRSIPSAGSEKTTSYTLTTSDRAEFVQVGSGGSITVPNSTFSAGDVVVIYNNHSAAITITLSTTNAYIAGTNTNKTSVSLATRGVCNILFVSSTVAILTGNIS